jgi:hypothetical protein
MKQAASRDLLAGILSGLLFVPEDGGDMFLQNVGLLSPDYRALCPRKYNSSRNFSIILFLII